MTLLGYQGCLGSVEFDQDERLLYDELARIPALVSYEAEDADGLVRAAGLDLNAFVPAMREVAVKRASQPTVPHLGDA